MGEEDRTAIQQITGEVFKKHLYANGWDLPFLVTGKDVLRSRFPRVFPHEVQARTAQVGKLLAGFASIQAGRELQEKLTTAGFNPRLIGEIVTGLQMPKDPDRDYYVATFMAGEAARSKYEEEAGRVKEEK